MTEKREGKRARGKKVKREEREKERDRMNER